MLDFCDSAAWVLRFLGARNESVEEMQSALLENKSIFAVTLIAIYLSIVYIFSVFCDTLLINKRQDGCVVNLDCFLYPLKSSWLPSLPSLSSEALNCTEQVELLENGTVGVMEDNATNGIICYKFVYDFGQAYADAGGALTATAVEIFLTTAMLIQISRRIGIFCRCHDKLFPQIFLHLLYTIVAVIMSLFVFPGVLNVLYSEVLDIPKVINPIIIMVQIFFVTNIPWYLISIPNKYAIVPAESGEAVESKKTVNATEQEVAESIQAENIAALEET